MTARLSQIADCTVDSDGELRFDRERLRHAGLHWPSLWGRRDVLKTVVRCAALCALLGMLGGAIVAILKYRSHDVEVLVDISFILLIVGVGIPSAIIGVLFLLRLGAVRRRKAISEEVFLADPRWSSLGRRYVTAFRSAVEKAYRLPRDGSHANDTRWSLRVLSGMDEPMAIEIVAYVAVHLNLACEMSPDDGECVARNLERRPQTLIDAAESVYDILGLASGQEGEMQ